MKTLNILWISMAIFMISCNNSKDEKASQNNLKNEEASLLMNDSINALAKIDTSVHRLIPLIIEGTAEKQVNLYKNRILGGNDVSYKNLKYNISGLCFKNFADLCLNNDNCIGFLIRLCQIDNTNTEILGKDFYNTNNEKLHLLFYLVNVDSANIHTSFAYDLHKDVDSITPFQLGGNYARNFVYKYLNDVLINDYAKVYPKHNWQSYSNTKQVFVTKEELRIFINESDYPINGTNGTNITMNYGMFDILDTAAQRQIPSFRTMDNFVNVLTYKVNRTYSALVSPFAYDINTLCPPPNTCFGDTY